MAAAAAFLIALGWLAGQIVLLILGAALYLGWPALFFVGAARGWWPDPQSRWHGPVLFGSFAGYVALVWAIFTYIPTAYNPVRFYMNAVSG